MRKPIQPPAPESTPPRYHHGALKPALLVAAELILKRDGIEGLTLRATAREAGVSHAAPKNHFGDVRGLLSELAAVGFVRFRITMLAEIEARLGRVERLDAIGIGYVKFAKANPELFTLMFRSERLDFDRPVLKAANQAAFALLGQSAAEADAGSATAHLSGTLRPVEHIARIAAAWSLVHGFACLMLDGRLRPLVQMTGGELDELALLRAIMKRTP